MEERFFGKQIDVATEGDVLRPVSFVLDGEEYLVQHIMASWADYGFGEGPRRKHRWWERHHRNYYRVRTTSGRTFEIYHDRGVSLSSPHYKRWYVTRELPGIAPTDRGPATEDGNRPEERD